MRGSRLVRAAIVLALLAGAGAIALAVLYQFFGLRFVPGGSGVPRLAFVTPADEQAQLIEAHRAAQRAAAIRSGSGGEAARTAPGSGTAGPADALAPSPPGAVSTAGSEPAPSGTSSPAADEDGAGPGEPSRSLSSSADASSPAAASSSADAAALGHWTDFRGPARDGHYRQQPILTNWPAGGLTPMWRQPIGGGYASFVAAKGRAFTIEQRAGNEVVSAYDIETGRELWTHAWPELFRESMGGDGPRATPTWSDGVVYALGARGELRALDEATGRMLWRTDILEDAGARNLEWGMAASPLVVRDTVVVLPGGPNGRSVVAYNRRTGERVWSAQDDKAAYAAPMLARLAGREQLLVLSGERLMGLTPDRGDLLWSYPWRTTSDINVSQPLVVSENRVFVSSGYGVGAAVVEITDTGSDFEVREVWRNTRMKNKFTSSVLHDGFVYGLDEAILACVDASTGALRWKGGRYGYGQILLAGDRIVVLTEDGDLVLVTATPDRHQELAAFPAITGKTWNHLAIESGRLLVRNLREMAAFDLRVR